MSSDLVIGEDGIARCRWGASTPEYQAYHDNEWGLPVGDDNRVFEKLCLEGFQAGLSWLTILRKPRRLPEGVCVLRPAAWSPVSMTPTSPGCLATRGLSAIVARSSQRSPTRRPPCACLRKVSSLAALVWRHEPGARPAPKTSSDLPASTPESKALSAELRRHGFRFVGETTAYAAMQSLGLVNDHLEGCHRRAITELARANFDVPG